MSSQRKRRPTARIGALLFGVALIPLIGLCWSTAQQVSSVRDTQAELTELEHAIGDLEALASLEAALIDENYWVQAEAATVSLNIPTALVESLAGFDLTDGAATARRVADESLGQLRSDELRVLIEQARADAATFDVLTDPLRDKTPLSDVVTGPLRDELAETTRRVISLASTLDDGERLVVATRAVQEGTLVRSNFADLVVSWFLLDITDEGGPPQIRELVGQRANYLDGISRLERLITTDSQSRAGLDSIRNDESRQRLLALLDTFLVEPASSTENDSGIELSELAGLAAIFLDGNDAVKVHFDFVTAADDDVKTEMDLIRQSVSQQVRNVWISTTLAVLVTILAVVVVTRSIVRPLRALATGAEALRSGQKTHPLPAKGPAEVQSAAAALNEAAAHMNAVERQALALAEGSLDDDSLATTAPGQLGQSLQSAVSRLRSSLAEREQYRQRLAHEASHDGLTTLPNRSAAIRHLSSALARTQRTGSSLAVFFLDLDGFKHVNDLYGHAAGDRVLQQIARRLVLTSREGDLVGRLGGDEFLIIAEPVRDPADAVMLAHRLLDAIAEPITLENSTYQPAASVGVAVADGHLTPDELVRDADLAVYQAKDGGRGRVAVCDELLRSRLLEEADLDQAIRQAITHDQLELHYQSTVDAATGQPDGLEALVRWERPGFGLVRPEGFIPFAERNDLIIEIDRWVINAAIRQLAQWNDHPVLGRMPMAINISGRHLLQADLHREVIDALERWDADPSRIVIEITESALVDDLPTASLPLEQLRRLGIRIAIDDFGTGYTSLAHLRSLPIDILKIDRSYTANLGNDNDLSLLKLIVDTGHLLGVSVTAEGIETEAQATTLRSLGSDILQGFRFSRPLNATELEVTLNSASGG